MGLLALGVLLLVVGLALSLTDVGDRLGLEGAFGLTLVEIGWLFVLVGVALAILHFVLVPRYGWGPAYGGRRFHP